LCKDELEEDEFLFVFAVWVFWMLFDMFQKQLIWKMSLKLENCFEAV